MRVAENPGFLGFGLGLRPQHYAEILNGSPEIDWFEVISENYMVPGGQPLRILDQIRERYPIVMHGVSLSIASTCPFRKFHPAWIHIVRQNHCIIESDVCDPARARNVRRRPIQVAVPA